MKLQTESGHMLLHMHQIKVELTSIFFSAPLVLNLSHKRMHNVNGDSATRLKTTLGRINTWNSENSFPHKI